MISLKFVGTNYFLKSQKLWIENENCQIMKNVYGVSQNWIQRLALTDLDAFIVIIKRNIQLVYLFKKKDGIKLLWTVKNHRPECLKTCIKYNVEFESEIEKIVYKSW